MRFKIGDITVCRQGFYRKVVGINGGEYIMSYLNSNIRKMGFISTINDNHCNLDKKDNKLNRKLYPNLTEVDGYLVEKK